MKVTFSLLVENGPHSSQNKKSPVESGVGPLLLDELDEDELLWLDDEEELDECELDEDELDEELKEDELGKEELLELDETEELLTWDDEGMSDDEDTIELLEEDEEGALVGRLERDLLQEMLNEDIWGLEIEGRLIPEMDITGGIILLNFPEIPALSLASCES